MLSLQHQFNNSVKQHSYDRIPLSLRMFEVFTTSSKLQHQPPVALFEKSFTALSISPCGRLSQITKTLPWVRRLFSALFQVYGKPPTLHPIRDSPLGSYSANLEAIGLICDDIWTVSPQPVLCAVRRCALCVLTRRPAGRWIRWAAGDCFKGTII